MPKHSHPDFLIKLILRARAIETETDGRDRGYIMLVTTVLSVMLFSLLAAYLVLTDLNKTATSAFVDGNNTFMASEFGLNMRASAIKNKFEGYSRPSGSSPTGIPVNTPTTPGAKPTPSELIAAMQKCISGTSVEKGNGDFACTGSTDTRYNFKSDWKDVKGTSNGSEEKTNTSNYTAYTFVADKTTYDTTTKKPPTETIGTGELYAGLKAQKYQYTVYASAVDNQSTVGTTNANTVLQMDFKSRVIPLFQFAAFYEGDLEVSSASNLTLAGWVHTNGNFYGQPITTDSNIKTTLNSKLTAAGNIYNRIDTYSPNDKYSGKIRVLMLNNSSYAEFPSYSTTTDAAGNPRALSSTEISALENVKDGNAGAQGLTTPSAGFLRKRNYYNSRSAATAAQKADAIGEAWGNADMRLEMFPERGSITNETIIPFNFTAIKNGTAATNCSTTLNEVDEVVGSVTLKKITDPDENYIAPDRTNASTLQCTLFTKGQLQSLRQPVMVLTEIKTDAALRTGEGTTLGKPATLPTAPSITATDATKTKILRALQVAIASTPTPIAYDSLDKTLTDSSLATVKSEFDRLIATISELSAADRVTLSAARPTAIAALRNAWFLPAPIQRVRTNDNPATTANPRNSGFYDGRERRWITMLQTNIKSLSVWNRDGLYVEATDTDKSTAYTASTTTKDNAFNSGVGNNFTDGLAFSRLAADSAKPAGSLQQFGLGASDTSEGGLVFHATVSDNLNGDTTTNASGKKLAKIEDADDITFDTTKPIYKKNADNTNAQKDGVDIIMDYARKYKNAINTTGGTDKAYAPHGYYGESPYGFAFNDGNYLPGALTLVTDQAIYIQGNFNNHGAAQSNTAANTPSNNRLPAAIMGDTITVLSNQCVAASSDKTTRNHLAVPASQINCGLPRVETGSVDVTVTDVDKNYAEGYYTAANSNFVAGTTKGPANTAIYYTVSNSTAVNAAFLSYSGVAWGNLGTNRGYSVSTTAKRSSGEINNYMRMLENWGSTAITRKFFNYTGSFVSLGSPLESSGGFYSTGKYYLIPQRNFNFDDKFELVDGLPPLTPRAVYLQQEVFKRTF
jgi:hypothetical protein